MSTYAGQLESASTLPAERVLERRLTRYLIAIGGVLAGVGACVLVATSDHLVDPLAYGLLLADAIIGTVAVAIYWLVRRPGSRMALILLVLAAAFVGVSLQGAASPLLHSIGVLFDAVIFTLAYYAVFAFPHGRLVSPLDKLLIAAPLLIVFTSQRAPHRYFIGPLAGRDRDRRRTRNGHQPVPPTVSAAVAALTPQVQTLTRETRSSPSDRSSCGVTLPTRSQRVDDDDVQGDDDECPQRIAG